jgi:hypothetical protein
MQRPGVGGSAMIPRRGRPAQEPEDHGMLVAELPGSTRLRTPALGPVLFGRFISVSAPPLIYLHGDPATDWEYRDASGLYNDVPESLRLRRWPTPGCARIAAERVGFRSVRSRPRVRVGSGRVL